MKRINSLTDLLKRKEELTASQNDKVTEVTVKGKTRIRVHMGTSGIASGAKAIHDFMTIELEKRNIDAFIVKTGDLGYSFAEPTLEVTRPGEDPIVFGNVDRVRADEIIEKYIKNGELIEGILPANYRFIEQ